MQDFGRFIEAFEPIELQVWIRKHTIEQDEDILELFFSKVTEVCANDFPDDLTVDILPKVLSLSYDDSMFRAISKPILKAIHDGPLSGEDRSFKFGQLVPKLARSIQLIHRYFEFCRKQNDAGILSCWYVETSFDKLEARRSLQHEIDLTKLAESGYSINLWVKRADSESWNSLITLARRDKQTKQPFLENIFDVSTKADTLRLTFGKTADMISLDLTAERNHLLSIIIEPSGNLQVWVDGNLKYERKALSVASLPSDAALTTHLLNRYTGFMFGYLTIYDSNKEKASLLNKRWPNGVQTSQDYIELNRIFENRNLHQILNPVFQGTLL